MARTHEEIKKDVVDQIFWDDSVDAADIQVEVLGGQVTLTGHVPNYAARADAALDAEAVPGVRGVDNRITVEIPAAPVVPNDADIRASAQSVLRWRPGFDTAKIDVDVNEGILTLTGNVDAYWKRYDAEEAVANLSGVIDVVNELTVVPTKRIEDEVIADDVERALDRNLLVAADDVTVKVENGEVALTGTVPTITARRAAGTAAAYTAGILSVENNLTVAA